MSAQRLVTEHIDLWTSAIKAKATQGRGSSKKRELYGIKKLRELILELAVRGKLVPQDPNDEPASVLLKRIAVEKAQLVKEKKIKKQKALPPISDDDVVEGIPAGWIWTRLGEIAEIGPRNSGTTDDTKVSFVPMPLISKSYKGDHGSEDRTWSEIKKGYTHFADGVIAVAKITPCFENSKAAIFRGLKNGVGAGTTELHVARPIGNTLDRLYILLYLKAPQFLIIGETKMTGTAGQKRVPTDFFAGNPLPLPPLPEQHRIVAKVDELMALCDQLEQQTEASIDAHATLVETLLATLTQSADAADLEQNWTRIADHFDTLFTTDHSIDQLKQCVLQLAVMGKLVPQDPNDEPAAVLLRRIASERDRLVKEEKLKTKANLEITDTEKYLNVPEEWGHIRLGNLAKFIDYRGKTPTKLSEGIRLITAKNVRFGHISLQPEEFISEDEYKAWMTRGFPKVGDLLFTPEAPLGNIAIIDITEKFALAQRAICFQLHEPACATFLKIFIMSLPFQEQLILNATGMTVTGIKASKLKEIPVPLPSLDEQHRIVAKVDQLMTLCDQLKARLQQAQQTQLHLTDVVVEQAVG